jgi:hypothetical protein
LNHGLNHLMEKDVLIEWWDKVLPQVHKTLVFQDFILPCDPVVRPLWIQGQNLVHLKEEIEVCHLVQVLVECIISF